MATIIVTAFSVVAFSRYFHDNLHGDFRDNLHGDLRDDFHGDLRDNFHGDSRGVQRGDLRGDQNEIVAHDLESEERNRGEGPKASRCIPMS